MDRSLDRTLKVIRHWERLQVLSITENCVPITIEIDPTNRCNHRCTFCSSYCKSEDELSLDRVISLLDELMESEVLSISWKGGGEPTLHPHLPAMLWRGRTNSFAQGLTTNGSKLKDDVAEAAAQISWVRISLDAATEATHFAIHRTTDFKRILKNISNLVSMNHTCRIGLNMTVSPDNFQEIIQFARLGHHLGVDYVAFRPAYYEVFGLSSPVSSDFNTQIQDAFDLVRNFDWGNMEVAIGQMGNAGRVGSYIPKRCLAPALRPTIGADGEVYACCDLRGHKEFSFGNINDNTFWEIWNSERRSQVFEQTRSLQCLKYCSKAYDFYNRVLDYLGDPSRQIDCDFM